MKKVLPILLLISLIFNFFLLVELISKTGKINFFFKKPAIKTTLQSDSSRDNVFNEINPDRGYEIKATYGDLGPAMLKSGVIDLVKFKAVYEKNGQPLTAEQLSILTDGSKRKIKITRENSYFLLNFFWAVGLHNKSQILDKGEMMKYGGAKEAGNFASTGGWTLAKKEAMNYYSKSRLIVLTQAQEALVAKVASNIYRPCCDNPTSFPDCNHGMALLGVLELMAGNGATEKDMYEAAKYFNAFFFPGNYYDLALYFKNKENKSFKEVPGQVILSKEYSSASGWQTTKKWLTDKGIVKTPPKQSGGGCGV